MVAGRNGYPQRHRLGALVKVSRWFIVPTAVALLLAGCQDSGGRPTLINGCDNPVEVVADTAIGVEPGDDLMPLRDRRSTTVIEPGASYRPGVANFTYGSITAVVFGPDEAKMWKWGVDVTGSPEFTITGGLCLEPLP